MERPKITKEQVVPLLKTRFVNVADLQYKETGHYFNVSRHSVDEMVALYPDEKFKNMLPDAVTVIVIVRTPGEEPRLLLTREFRYPCGQFLLSPPAGLMDPGDRSYSQPQIATAIREVKEETGLVLKDTDKAFVVSPLAFSSPGLTDESNGLVCVIAYPDDENVFSSAAAESTERIGDYTLVTRKEALRLLKQGRDDEGIFYSVYTWMALTFFVSGLWEDWE